MVVSASRERTSPLQEAIAVVEDEDRFAAAQSTGMAFLRISALLREEGERCADERGRAAGDCDVYFAGAGQAQILSIQVLDCPRPELFDVRADVRGYLSRLSTAPDEARLPELPRCG